jgi:hypothetical protein
MVRAFVVFAVIVADPPREMADPFTVTELFTSAAFGMEVRLAPLPEKVVAVTVPTLLRLKPPPFTLPAQVARSFTISFQSVAVTT